ESHSWQHFTESLGAALFILGFVSLALEYRDLVRYTSWVLKKQLLDREYIRTLSPESLRELKLSVDEKILGASQLRSKGGFYEFVANNGRELLKMPYRREMTDLSEYLIVPGDPEVFKRNTVTRYAFVKGFSREAPMVVRWGGNYVQTPHPTLDSLEITIGENKWALTDKTRLTAHRNTSATTQIELPCQQGGQPPIQLLCCERSRGGMLFDSFGLSYEIPRSRDFREDDEVVVEIRDTIFVAAKID